jgi:hypothetical protein
MINSDGDEIFNDQYNENVMLQVLRNYIQLINDIFRVNSTSWESVPTLFKIQIWLFHSVSLKSKKSLNASAYWNWCQNWTPKAM